LLLYTRTLSLVSTTATATTHFFSSLLLLRPYLYAQSSRQQRQEQRRRRSYHRLRLLIYSYTTATEASEKLINSQPATSLLRLLLLFLLYIKNICRDWDCIINEVDDDEAVAEDDATHFFDSVAKSLVRFIFSTRSPPPPPSPFQFFQF